MRDMTQKTIGGSTRLTGRREGTRLLAKTHVAHRVPLAATLVSGLLLTGLLLAITLLSATPAWADPLRELADGEDIAVTQHDGDNRQETAARASAKAYPDPSEVDSVILAYSYDFPDALAASYLAGALDAPILLCDTLNVPDTTAAELRRLEPSAVYIVGGTGVISSRAERSLGSFSSVTSVTRLGGEGREETAYLIANAARDIRGTPTTAFVVNAADFPDALSAGSLSAGRGVPILLTATDDLDGWVWRFLIDNNVKDVIIVGGPGSVSDDVKRKLEALSPGPVVSRWAGSDRYATAAEVLDQASAKWGLNPTVIGLASGEGFPDALVGGAAVGNRGGLLSITDPDALSAASSKAITTHQDALSDIEIFGGNGTIRIADEVQALLAASANWKMAYARVLDGYKKAVDERLSVTGDDLVDIVTRAGPTSDMNAYALKDITNDGIPELFICRNPSYDPTADGIARIFTLRKGSVEIYHRNSAYISLLKNDILLGTENVGAFGVYTYHKAEPGGVVWQTGLFNGAIDGWAGTPGWYREPYEGADYPSYIAITDQELSDIQTAYGDPVTVDWRPVTSWRTAA
jgi:putative cell wall-binding protein